MLLLNLIDYGVIFFATGLVDAVVMVFARNRPVRRNDIQVQLINVMELCGFSLGGASHAGQLLVEAEVILNRDRGECLRLAVNLHSLFGFNGLMQTIAPASTRHLTAGKLIDDHDLVLLNHVLDVLLEEAVGAQQLRNVMDALRLRVAMLLPFRFAPVFFLRRERGIEINLGKFVDQIRQHE